MIMVNTGGYNIEYGVHFEYSISFHCTLFVSRPDAHFNAGIIRNNETDYLFERFKGWLLLELSFSSTCPFSSLSGDDE